MENVFSLRRAVEARYSVRSYENRPLENNDLNKLFAYAGTLDNPFASGPRIQLVQKDCSGKGEKLGTYGIIKGASQFLAVCIKDGPAAGLALGYEFEQLLLYAVSLGIGSCWLGGTFNRSAFSSAIEIREGETFSILSPIGYPAEKKSLTERIMRRAIRADRRRPWEELFFDGSFSRPLSKINAGDRAFALEMLRLAPSAVNAQPWRLLVDKDAVHFYKKPMPAAASGTLDMQSIDMGIALCHFHLAMKAEGKEGRFERINYPGTVPQELVYITSWIDG